MRILITGADGQLGRDLLDALAGRVPAGGRRCALLGPEGPRAGLNHEVLAHRHRHHARRRPRRRACTPSPPSGPSSSSTAARFTAVDLCETEVDTAFAVNAVGTRNVAEAAALVGAHMVYVSTDYVFDGTAGRPYREWDAPCPTSVYGASKLAGERECRPGSTIVRTSWLCGAHGANMVVDRAPPGRRRGRAALRRRPARVAHLHAPTWPRPSSRSGSTAGPASST